MTGQCPVKGCPTANGPCAFHGQKWPASFRATDRIIRQRPGQTAEPPTARSRPVAGAAPVQTTRTKVYREATPALGQSAAQHASEVVV